MKLIAFCSFLMFSLYSYCQNNDAADVTNVTKVTLLPLGISHEMRVGKLQTLHVHACVNTPLAFTSYSDDINIDWYIDPTLSMQYRYYYNFNQRSDKGRRTEKNSLNYIASMLEGSFSKLPLSKKYNIAERRMIGGMGVLWGMQRNYAGRFSLDLNIGLGYVFSKSNYTDASGQHHIVKESHMSMPGHITLGIWLGKR